MKTLFTSSVLLLLLLAFSCKSRNKEKTLSIEEILQGSLEAVAPAITRDSLQTIISLANCISPKGDYTTEVHTAKGGYQFFRQVYSFKPDIFEACLINDSTGYEGTDTAILSEESVEMIRGHAFHAILLELPDRFHDFTKLDNYSLRAKDRLGNNCTLYFENDSKRLNRLVITNSPDKRESINITYSKWRKSGSFLLPFEVTISQGGKNFIFRFSSIQINSPGFRRRLLKK